MVWYLNFIELGVYPFHKPGHIIAECAQPHRSMHMKTLVKYIHLVTGID